MGYRADDAQLLKRPPYAICAAPRELWDIAERVSDATYSRAVSLPGEEYTAKVLMGIIAINLLNRVGATKNMVPRRTWCRRQNVRQ